MSVSIRKARDFVYSSGTRWERALFAHLFQDGSLERLHQCLACYRNPDGGWGNAIEHDVRTPDSHPAALEYILGVMVRDLSIPVGSLFNEASKWLENNLNEDGTLQNPPSLLDYPLAPWWKEWGGQKLPDSITGNLARIGKASPKLLESTQKWAQANLTVDKVLANDWLFMAYHAFDYYFGISDFPDLEVHRHATLDNIVSLAAKAPEKQYFVVFQFAPTPDSPVARALPNDLLKRCLDYLQDTQQEDGRWLDEHNMPGWQPYVTILVLSALKSYGRLSNAEGGVS